MLPAPESANQRTKPMASKNCTAPIIRKPKTPIRRISGSSVKINNSGFTKVDVALSYYLKNLPLKDQKTTLEFKINNLLDEDYDEVFGYNAPGIEMYAGMRISF